MLNINLNYIFELNNADRQMLAKETKGLTTGNTSAASHTKNIHAMPKTENISNQFIGKNDSNSKGVTNDLSDKINPTVGTLLGNRYKLIEKIQEKRNTCIYKAKCLILNRFVMVEIFGENNSDGAEGFINTAVATSKLNHPNLLSVFDCGRENNISYAVMEYIESETLDSYLKKHDNISVACGCKIASQILRVLEYMNNSGIEHQNLCPQNIFITSSRNIKVSFVWPDDGNSSYAIHYIEDFNYMSPEQAKGTYKQILLNTDIYALGCIMYRIFAGRSPFESDSNVKIALDHISSIPASVAELNSNVPIKISNLIGKYMSKSAVDRGFLSKNDIDADIRLLDSYCKKEDAEHYKFNDEDSALGKAFKNVASLFKRK